MISGTIYHYNGASYDSVTKDDYLNPWDGFWLATRPNSNGKAPKVLFPSNVQIPDLPGE